MSLLKQISSAFKAATTSSLTVLPFRRPITTIITRNILPSYTDAEPDPRVPVLSFVSVKEEAIKYWYKDSICILTKTYSIIPLSKLSPTALRNISPVYSSTDIKIPAVIQNHQSAVDMLNEMKGAEEDAEKAAEESKKCAGCGKC